MKVTINADDFGMSHTRNVVIDKLMRSKICDRASIVVNTDYSQEAFKMAKAGGYLNRLTLHINLTSGYPLSQKIRKCSLYCSDNSFLSRPIITSVKQILPFHIKKLRREIESQISKAKENGIKLSMVDSHNWVHLRIPVWLALYPLLDKYNITSVRPMWEGYRTRDRAGKWKKYFKFIYLFHGRYCKYFLYQYSSNIEQFLCNEVYKRTNIENAELFVHPDLKEDKVMDMSSAYTARGRKTVEENIRELHEVLLFNNRGDK